eukprot:COSAG05_NODE_22946_length_261_cov_0.641975_1_plen_73_part_10
MRAPRADACAPSSRRPSYSKKKQPAAVVVAAVSTLARIEGSEDLSCCSIQSNTRSAESATAKGTAAAEKLLSI